jgi:hypothetical protein
MELRVLEILVGVGGGGGFLGGGGGGGRGLGASGGGVLGIEMAWCGVGPFVVLLEVQREKVICSFVGRVDLGVEADDLVVAEMGGFVGRGDLGCIVGLDAMMLDLLELLFHSTSGRDS